MSVIGLRCRSPVRKYLRVSYKTNSGRVNPWIQDKGFSKTPRLPTVPKKRMAGGIANQIDNRAFSAIIRRNDHAGTCETRILILYYSRT